MATDEKYEDTMNFFFEKHYREYATLHKKSFYHDEVTYNRHIRGGLGLLNMSSISLKEIEGWILKQKKSIKRKKNQKKQTKKTQKKFQHKILNA